MKGTSFILKFPDKVEQISKKLLFEIEREEKLFDKKIENAITIIYKIATARRPMMTVEQAIALGRVTMAGKVNRVSDPNAKIGVPVRTGALRASILKEVKKRGQKTIGRIHTESPYAAYLEFGTSRMAPRPYMRPAISETREGIKRILEAKDA